MLYNYNYYYLYHVITIYLLAVGTNVNFDSPQKLTLPSGGNGQFFTILPAGPPTSQGRVHGDDFGAIGQPWHFNSFTTYKNED